MAMRDCIRDRRIKLEVARELTKCETTVTKERR